MSDEQTPDTTEPTAAEATTPAVRPSPIRPLAASHESDRMLRPGFRNPPTPKSKSQQKAKKKK